MNILPFRRYQVGMAAPFFEKAHKFFQSLQNSDTNSGNDLQKCRLKTVEEMKKESEKGHFFCALTMFHALIFIGLGTFSDSDVDTLIKGCSNDRYQFKEAEIESAIKNDLFQTLMQNWKALSIRSGKPWRAKDVKSAETFQNRLEELFSGKVPKLQKCFEAAGGSIGTCFLQDGWPTKESCPTSKAIPLFKALGSDIEDKALLNDDEAYQFVLKYLTRDSESMRRLDERVKDYMDDPKHTDFPKLSAIVHNTNVQSGAGQSVPGKGKKKRSKSEKAAEQLANSTTSDKQSDSEPESGKWVYARYPLFGKHSQQRRPIIRAKINAMKEVIEVNVEKEEKFLQTYESEFNQVKDVGKPLSPPKLDCIPICKIKRGAGGASVVYLTGDMKEAYYFACIPTREVLQSKYPSFFRRKARKIPYHYKEEDK